jgi:hypothetical protein
MKSVKPLLATLIITCFVCTSALAWNPFTPTPIGNKGGNSGGGNGVPIDGGITILLAAGIGLGAKKIYDRKKKKEQPVKE